nr:MAG: ATPase [Chloroflexota bacterium]
MSVIKQQLHGQEGRFDWEQEETLVDRRNRLPYKIRRFIKSIWLWVFLIGLIIAALFNADVMRAVLMILNIALQLVATIAIFLFQFVLLFWFLSRARMYTIMPGAEGVSFADYRGQPEILEQAKQIVMLLRGVKAFEGAGGEPLNGLLLEGPPGTGKTWLAQAISTEAGVPFFYVDTSSLQAMFLGVGALKVMRMYSKARKAAKEYGAAVIFLDEIDSIGSRAGVSSVGGTGGYGGIGGGFFAGGNMGLLSTMLIEMSGFSLEHGWRARLRTWWYKTILRRKPPAPQKRVLTIGATNRIQALDPALLRPGRFDKKMRIDIPDMEGRRDIFAYYLSKMAHDETMDPALLATETPGYTPADIKYLLNEALRHALFEGRTYMTYRDFQRAQPEHEMGLRAPLKHMSKEARERLAYHEAGHAVAVRLFLPDHRISRITIVRQGTAFGHVSHYPAREAYGGMIIKDRFMNMLRVSVAGKAAEMEFCGLQNQTLGVAGDFAMIRRTLYAMAAAGMFGPLGAVMGNRKDYVESGSMVTPEMAQAMEEAFQQVLTETRRALREHSEIVKGLVELLLEREELLADEVRAYFDQFGLYTPEATMVRDGEEISILTPRLPDEKAPVAAAGK